MFGSKSLTVHLARGIIGIGALAIGVTQQVAHPWLMFASLPLALVALRGCPMCWTVGLVQTVVAKFTGRPLDGACADGSCAVRSARVLD
jgi:hypothetical protein